MRRMNFFNVYAALFIYVPLIAQMLAFLCLDLSDAVRMAQGFSWQMKLPIFCMIYLPLQCLILLVYGFVFGRKTSPMPTRLLCLALFIMPVYTLLTANLYFILHHWTSILIVAFGNPTFLPTNIFMPGIINLFASIPHAAFIPQLAYVPFALGLGIGMRKSKTAKITETGLSFMICLILLLGFFGQWRYQIKERDLLPMRLLMLPSAPEEKIRQNFGWVNGTVPLRDSPALTMKPPLPVLDGATALCPIFYSVYEPVCPPKQHECQRKIINCSSSPAGYKNLINGKADLLFAAAPSKEQRKAAADAGLTLVLTPIGREAFVFLVNKQNPVKSLSLQNVQDIYTGKMTNWREVSGPDEHILAFQRNPGSGSQTAMENLVMKGLPLKKPFKEEFLAGMDGLIDGVADYRNARNAIGYSFRYYATTMQKNDNIALLSIDGIAPTRENIQNGTYPLSGDFYIVSARPLSPNAQKLKDWFLSPQGQALIEDVGYVPIHPVAETASQPPPS
jgi:phosphate transport system substrate-binding protein